MLETLLVITLSFGMGFGTRVYTEPVKECKSLNPKVPEHLFKTHPTRDCPEFENKTTGNTNECLFPADEKIWKIPDDEYKKLSRYIKQSRGYLQECNDIILKYNKDKFIIRN